MAIPMTNLKAQYQALRAELEPAVQQVMQQGQFILGERVAQFEREFATYCGVSETIGVANGTDAIGMALKALGVGPGDEVITTPFTFIATVEGIVETGATPVFADIDPTTYLLQPAAIAAKINLRTKAIVPVHLYGAVCDMPAIMTLAKQHGLKVVEDAAQAHGAAWSDAGSLRRAGSFADAATFSFYPGKNLGAFGDAGAVVTSQPELAQALRLLRNHGRVAKYQHQQLGRNSRMDGMQAAILSIKLKYLDDWNQRRWQRATFYQEQLQRLNRQLAKPLILPSMTSSASHCFHLYTIRAPQRDALAAYLKQQSIEAAVHYPMALHQQPALHYLKVATGSLPHAEQAGREVISLPLCPEISTSEQQQVVEAIATFYQRHA